MTNIKTAIAHEGQSYVDEPIYTETKPVPLAYELASAFGRPMDPLIRNLDGHNRVRLRWMKPGPDGKLIPKKRTKHTRHA